MPSFVSGSASVVPGLFCSLAAGKFAQVLSGGVLVVLLSLPGSSLLASCWHSGWSNLTHALGLTAWSTQVNEAVNDLLIDEEDFEGLKSSIASFDNFDQVGI